jgi:23S rRNA pseudouridine1911/1915/1917 synthase
LDKDTSGLLVVAKTNPAHLELTRQFAEHSIKRKYLALVEGMMEFDENVIEFPIGRHPTRRKSMAVSFSAGARYAKTRYRTLERLKEFSLIELEPFTGRTHQLRVHLAHVGHPVLGDVKYGKRGNFERLALHAVYLGFRHPLSCRSLEFRCDMPAEFKEFLRKTKKPLL